MVRGWQASEGIVSERFNRLPPQEYQESASNFGGLKPVAGTVQNRVGASSPFGQSYVLFLFGHGPRNAGTINYVCDRPQWGKS